MDKYEKEAIEQRETDLLIERLEAIWKAGRKHVVKAIQNALGPVEIQYPHNYKIKAIHPSDKSRGYDNYWMFELGEDGIKTGNRDFGLSNLISLNEAFCRYDALLNRIQLEKELARIRTCLLTKEFQGD